MINVRNTAPNERFCVIAAVTPQIIQCKFASYYPAASAVEAATTQSRFYVGCNAGATVRLRNCLTATLDNEVEIWNIDNR
jgi:hypothetical protein